MGPACSGRKGTRRKRLARAAATQARLWHPDRSWRAGRPSVEFAPLIHPRLKDVRLGKDTVAAALQVVEEERQFDPFAVIDTRLGAERNIAQPVAIAEI